MYSTIFLTLILLLTGKTFSQDDKEKSDVKPDDSDKPDDASGEQNGTEPAKPEDPAQPKPDTDVPDEEKTPKPESNNGTNKPDEAEKAEPGNGTDTDKPENPDAEKSETTTPAPDPDTNKPNGTETDQPENPPQPNGDTKEPNGEEKTEPGTTPQPKTDTDQPNGAEAAKPGDPPQPNPDANKPNEPESPKPGDTPQPNSGTEQFEQLQKSVKEIQDNLANLETKLLAKMDELQEKINGNAKPAEGSKPDVQTGDNNTKPAETAQGETKPAVQTGGNKCPPRNCKEVSRRGHLSGIFEIQPEASPDSFEVMCNMETNGGGWVYLMNRAGGTLDFDLNWEDYKNGFGNLSGEFWLGLEKTYQLTAMENSELYIELIGQRETRFAHYEEFSIGSEIEGFPLKSIRGYRGNDGNDFMEHEGSRFSTKDRDQDMAPYNCAERYRGGWWYTKCYFCLFTGSVQQGPLMRCSSFPRFNENLEQVRMMIRPSYRH